MNLRKFHYWVKVRKDRTKGNDLKMRKGKKEENNEDSTFISVNKNTA